MEESTVDTSIRELRPTTIRCYAQQEQRFIGNFKQMYGTTPDIKQEDMIRQYLMDVASLFESAPAVYPVHVQAVKRWYRMQSGKVLMQNACKGSEPALFPVYGNIAASSMPNHETILAILGGMENQVCRLIANFVYGTGARIDRLRLTRVCDVVDNHKCIILRKDDGSICRKIECPEILEIPLARETQGKEKEDPLFSLRFQPRIRRWSPISVRAIQHSLRQSALKQGNSSFTLRTLMGGYIVYQLRRGRNPRTIQSVTGFKNIRSILRYQNIVCSSDMNFPGPLHGEVYAMHRGAPRQVTG